MWKGWRWQWFKAGSSVEPVELGDGMEALDETLEESGLESSQTLGERCERLEDLEDPLEYLEDLVRFW